MSEPDLQYNYTCPSCSGRFSMPLERIPPARARFPCGTCGESMDFPSRDQARTLARLQAEAAVKEAAAAELEKTQPIDLRGKPFRVDKRGWEDDYFDRRGIRNLIRTGELVEADRVFYRRELARSRKGAGAQIALRPAQVVEVRPAPRVPDPHGPHCALHLPRQRPAPLRGVRAGPKSGSGHGSDLQPLRRHDRRRGVALIPA